MKKNILLSLIITMSTFLFGYMDTRALVRFPICEYVDANGVVQSEIIYYPENINGNSWNDPGPWTAHIRYNAGLLSIIDPFSGSQITSGSFKKALQNDRVSYNMDTNRFPDSFENTFTCPPYAFADFDYFDEVCFGNYETCGSRFEKGPFKLDNSADAIFSKIDSYFDQYEFTDNDVQTFINNGDVETAMRNSIKNKIKEEYSFDVDYKYPAFIINYIEKVAIKDSKFSELKAKAKTKIESDTTMTEEEKQAEIEKVEAKNKSSVFKGSLTLTPPITVRPGDDCSGVLGAEMTKIVNNIFKFVQYLGPILIVAFSIVDFIKAAISGDDGDMKKASTKLGKRIVCGILLFFAPLICKILLDLGNITVPDTCIGKYDSITTVIETS